MMFAIRWISPPGTAIAALAIMGGLVAGCATSSGPDLRRVDASLDALTDQEGGGSNKFAQQSQRDVEAILKSRMPAGSRAGTNRQEQDQPADYPQMLPSAPPLALNPSPPAAGPSIAAPSRNSIVWNDSKPAHSAPTMPRPSEPASATASAAPPQSNLFKPLDDPAAKSGQTAVSGTGSTSRPALGPDRLKQLMVDLSRELYATGAYSEAPLRQLMMIAAMSMIDPERRLEPQAIPDLTQPERELLGKLQAFFADLGHGLDGAKDVEKSIVEAVGKLRQSIVKEPQLKLATIALCTRVGGFGDYTAFDKHAFLAHSEQKAIVYLEIDDFSSELNQKGEFVTEISQQLTIYSGRDGIPVWKEDWQAAVDVTRNKRQDFFTVQVITLPKALSVGKYQLKVRVRDEKSGAEAENSVEFEMVADPKMAASVK